MIVIRTSLIFLLLACFGSAPAWAESLLIERNARPLLAEGTLEALVPWETPIEGFFVRSHHDVLPSNVGDSWTIQFDGLLKKARKFSVRDLKKRKKISFHAVLECSGNGRGLFRPQVSGIQWQRGAVGNAEWTGVRLADLIKELGISPEAVYATVEGYDEPVMKNEKNDAKFVRSIPLKLLEDSKAVLAWGMNRQPLPVVHGGPVRLVMPGIYGQNWIKWVKKITFTREPDPRMYARKAYRISDKPIDWIKVQTIVTSPAPDSKMAPGPLTLRGKAFTGTGTVVRVDVSMDGGRSWQAASLDTPFKVNGADHGFEAAWQDFRYEMTIREGHSYEVWTRATDSAGNVQPVKQEWNSKGYLYHAVERVRFSGSTTGAFLAEGKSLAQTHCQTCHSLGIAEGQRLEKEDWVKTVKKMEEYGLILGDAEVQKIAGYFAETFPPGTPVDGARRIDLAANPDQIVTHLAKQAGDPVRGRKLFRTHCASCHGTAGEGRTGPVLRGRALTDAVFWSTVMHGRNQMPPFSHVLTGVQIADLRAWVRNAE